MRLFTLVSLILLAASAGFADSTTSGGLTVSGQVGIGTFVPKATTEARMSASDQYGLRVSSQDGTPLLTLDANGRMAVQVSSPQARLDITGQGDTGDIALQLRVGNSSQTTLSSQIVFAYGSTETFRHSIRTRHVAGQDLWNTMDFFLWNSTGQSNALGSVQALSLQAVTDTSTEGVHHASMHIMPAGTPTAELEVSNGIATGAGTIHRLLAGTHSSRALKTDISYFPDSEQERAYEDVRALKHATFRYKRVVTQAGGRTRLVADERQPLIRGLVYEDAPESVRGPSRTVVLDYRVLNLELASQELDRRIKALEAKIADLETKKKKARSKR